MSRLSAAFLPGRQFFFERVTRTTLTALREASPRRRNAFRAASCCTARSSRAGRGRAPSEPVNFAEKLRQARLDAGLSQQQLADKSGVAMRTIQNWEGAERNPSNFAKVEQLAKVLGVSTTELLDDGDSDDLQSC